ncbi:PilZ domain-containing protein [Nannocystaceae bacterium ST9]
MGELRNQARVAVHYRVAVHHAGREARGTTENFSERGAMLSVDISPPLGAGDVVSLGVTLADGTLVDVVGRVRWVSSVLPGMVGVEFDLPMPVALAEHIQQMLAARFPAASVG